jgi:hypothetical protein
MDPKHVGHQWQRMKYNDSRCVKCGVILSTLLWCWPNSPWPRCSIAIYQKTPAEKRAVLEDMVKKAGPLPTSVMASSNPPEVYWVIKNEDELYWSEGDPPYWGIQQKYAIQYATIKEAKHARNQMGRVVKVALGP